MLCGDTFNSSLDCNDRIPGTANSPVSGCGTSKSSILNESSL